MKSVCLLVRDLVEHVAIFWYDLFLVLGDTRMHTCTPSFGNDCPDAA